MPAVGTFDFVAPVYSTLEWLTFGNALNEARQAFLSRTIMAERLLLIGEGDGRFLAGCLRGKAGGSITVIDSSVTMLARAKARASRIAHRTTLRFVHRDIRAFQQDEEKFDAIVTHFFLDLFRPESQRAVIREITTLADRDGFWVNVDYAPHLQTFCRRAIEWLQYRFDELFCGVEADRHYEPKNLIAESGWVADEQLRFLNDAVDARLYLRRHALRGCS